MPASIRDTYPPVPAGMVRTANCGTYDRALNAEVTQIAQAVSTSQGFPLAYLRYSTRGFEIAGSCMRWTEAYWDVSWNQADGTSHGWRFREDDEAGARERFALVTDPVRVSAKRQEAAMLEETVYAPARAARAAEVAARAQAEKERKAALRRHRAALRRGVAA